MLTNAGDDNELSVITLLLQRSKDVMLIKHFNELSVIILLLQRSKDVMLTNVFDDNELSVIISL